MGCWGVHHSAVQPHNAVKPPIPSSHNALGPYVPNPINEGPNAHEVGLACGAWKATKRLALRHNARGGTDALLNLNRNTPKSYVDCTL